jgi:Cu+-exporting ATPase
MKNIYQITGMTCNGCLSNVEKTLSEVQGVTKVEVSLKDKNATIEMDNQIPLETFKTALEKRGGNFRISL